MNTANLSTFSPAREAAASTADWERRLVARCRLAIRQCLLQANSECRTILATMGEPRRENLLQALSDAFHPDSDLQVSAMQEAFDGMENTLADLEMNGP